MYHTLEPVCLRTIIDTYPQPPLWMCYLAYLEAFCNLYGLDTTAQSKRQLRIYPSPPATSSTVKLACRLRDEW